MRLAHRGDSYGVFLGGDPRKFTPDPECSTEEDRERHRLACEKGDDCGPDFCRVMQLVGAPVGPGFGFGVTVFEEPHTGEGCEACTFLGPPELVP